MRRILLAAAVILAVSGTVFCADGGGKGAAPGGAAVSEGLPSSGTERDQVDAVDWEIMDLSAMYWAWRVAGLQDTSYEKLEKLSERWIIKPETRKELFKRMKLLLDEKKWRKLTPGEMKEFNAAKDRIRGILAPGSKDKKLVMSLTEDYCVELDARYWALRIQNGEKEVLELRKNWVVRSDLKKKLFEKMDENLKKENARLTREEFYKMDACKEKLR